MVRMILLGVINLYRWMPPRTSRCTMSPGCSLRALQGVRDGTMGIAGVARCAACCPEHTSGWER